MKFNNQILKNIKHQVLLTEPKATVILYGSHARGENNENSDFDILILLDKEKISRKDEKDIKYPLYDIEFETGKIISPLVLSKAKWNSQHNITPFYENVMKEGVVL